MPLIKVVSYMTVCVFVVPFVPLCYICTSPCVIFCAQEQLQAQSSPNEIPRGGDQEEEEEEEQVYKSQHTKRILLAAPSFLCVYVCVLVYVCVGLTIQPIYCPAA